MSSITTSQTPFQRRRKRDSSLPGTAEQRQKPHLWAYLFLCPSIALMLLFNYYPLVDTVRISMQSTDLFGRPSGFIGLANYVEMFASTEFHMVMLRTTIFVVLVVSIKLVLGLAIALPLSSGLAGTVLVRPIVLIPMAFSAAVASVIFKTMFTPRVGTFDQMLTALGLPAPQWLTSSTWAMISVLITMSWFSMGLIIMLFMAALDSVPKEVLEASDIDGVNWWQKIIRMQLPLISPTIFFIIVTQSIAALKEFTVINVLTEGGPNSATTTLTIELYNLAFGSNVDYGRSTAHGIVLMVIVGIVAFFQFKLGEKRVVY